MKPPPTESQVSSASAAPAASRATSRMVLGWRGAGVTVSNAIAVAGSKAIERRPARLEPLGLAHLGDERLGRVRIDAVRALAAEAEDHRLVGRVALAGEGERAEQRDLDRGDPVDRAGRDEPVGERRGGLHRPDRMRRRRADADLEELEDAEHFDSSISDRAAPTPLTLHDAVALSSSRSPSSHICLSFAIACVATFWSLPRPVQCGHPHESLFEQTLPKNQKLVLRSRR